MEMIENMLESLTESINECIKDFSKCRDLNQKKTQAEIIKLLCESLGVFFNAMKNSSPFPLDDFYDEDYDDEDEDVEEYELEKRRKIKNNKKSNKDSIPF